jgi:hypothetical protein
MTENQIIRKTSKIEKNIEPSKEKIKEQIENIELIKITASSTSGSSNPELSKK